MKSSKNNSFTTLFDRLLERKERVVVVGLGYVGLPLALAFSKKFQVTGFDVSENRISTLKKGMDINSEHSREEIMEADIEYTTNPESIRRGKFIVVAIPTPVDEAHVPDLSLVERASVTVGQNLSPGSVVVYESTVYPGVTEELCKPVLEKESGLICGRDFKIAYSPERVNPGDRVHTFSKICKVVSGMDEETLRIVSRVYSQVVEAGVHEAPSIKVAEAAKVIENTQRDLNIALMNELSMIFDLLGIDTKEVLKAAGTKWNFLPFTPGLVGGHCIGVDPYYLTYRAEKAGYSPQVILAGRKINDSMGRHVAERTVRLLARAGKTINRSKVLILGLTFKENISDIRNSRVVDIIKTLEEYTVEVHSFDPHVDINEAKKEFSGKILSEMPARSSLYDAVIVAVAHEDFQKMGLERILKLLRGRKKVLVDVKGIFDRSLVEKKGILYFAL